MFKTKEIDASPLLQNLENKLKDLQAKISQLEKELNESPQPQKQKKHKKKGKASEEKQLKDAQNKKTLKENQKEEYFLKQKMGQVKNKDNFVKLVIFRGCQMTEPEFLEVELDQ